MKPQSRRNFLTSSAALTSAAFTSGVLTSGVAHAKTAGHEICTFTKPLQSLTFDELGRSIAKLGFDGIELPVRAGGHIEPENVADELPKAHAALKKHGVNITLITTNVLDPNDKTNQQVVQTASALGIKRYRTNYFKYDLKKPITKQLQSFKPMIKELADLNRQYNITGCYQNHAGATNLGSTLWDLYYLIKDIPVEHLGVAFDIRHATIEAGSAWPTLVNLMRPHFAIVYVKDAYWPKPGAKATNCPLGEGVVNDAFFKTLRETNYTGPVSLHEEYLDHKDPKLVPVHLKAMADDFVVLRKWLKG